MIITRQKPLAEIIDYLKDCKRIFLIGCGDCATACKTGGQEQLDLVKTQLQSQGKEITGICIPESACVAAKLKLEWARHMKALKESEAILVFACGLGVQSVKDNDRIGLLVFPGCDSLSGAVMDGSGNFTEKCSMCAECLLAKTGGVCPITLCPKGLLNGPCGGMNKGKCELDLERDCAWVLIYKEAQKKNKLDEFKKINKARDFKKSLKPHKLNFSSQVSR